MKLNASEKNAYDAVEYLLWSARVKVSSVGLEEDLVLHPDFPSLAAISDALNEWQVPNLATRLSVEQLRQIPLPALAYLNIRGGILAPVKAVANDTIEWLDTRNGWQKENIYTFAERWDGATLLIEPGENAGELSYKQNKASQNSRNARNLFLIIGAVTALALCFSLRWDILSSAGNHYLYTLILKATGTIACGLLLWQSLESDNPFLQSLCQIGSQGNCNSILQSPAARITSWLSWSEVGFLYFACGFISLLLGRHDQQQALWSGCAVLSVLAIPYTLYSVWYQRFVAHQWCTICLAVQVTLWLEAIVTLSHLDQLYWTNTTDILALVALSLLIPALIWSFIKGPLIGANQVFGLRQELQKTKFGEKYIQATFTREADMPPIFGGMQTVQLGKPDAEHTLTVVTNPLCGPCSKRHQEVEELMKAYPNIRCQFVFLGSADALRVAAAFLSAPPGEVATLMHDWYVSSSRTTNSWLKKQGILVESLDWVPQLNLHARWCQLAGVPATPTVFLNNVKLPRAYQLKDVKHLAMQMKAAKTLPSSTN